MKRRTTKAKRKPSTSPLPTFLTQDEMKRLLAVIKNKRGRLTVQRVTNSHSSVYPMQPDLVKRIRSYLRSGNDTIPYLFISNRGVPIDRRTL